MASSRTKPSIHQSIKVALGYEGNTEDADVLKDWKERTSRVCKPCWELKYCPYGPLVEQSPTIPPERSGMIERNAYFLQCLDTNLVGSVSTLTDETREQYERWLHDEDILFQQAITQWQQRQSLDEASQYPTEDEQIDAWIGRPLPPIHIYRAPYEFEDRPIQEGDFPPEIWSELVNIVETLKNKYRTALTDGSIDNRHPLEPARRAWFKQQTEMFDPEDYPEDVPDVFHEGECNVFGHVCPVFFAAEVLTETSTERRRGRYIPFAVKIRVVRRDNYTCQHCGKHLQDDEVEFDHIIPISKGGSSEEHNVRLTCFDCNRDKSDDYVP